MLENKPLKLDTVGRTQLQILHEHSMPLRGSKPKWGPPCISCCYISKAAFDIHQMEGPHCISYQVDHSLLR